MYMGKITVDKAFSYDYHNIVTIAAKIQISYYFTDLSFQTISFNCRSECFTHTNPYSDSLCMTGVIVEYEIFCFKYFSPIKNFLKIRFGFEPNCSGHQAVSFFLPLVRRLITILRPLAVLILLRKPCSRFLDLFLG
jgi:hypothetical protein